jgi:glucokinase
MSDNRLAIGIDFGATTIKSGVVFQGHVIDRASPLATREFDAPAALIEAMVRTVGELREEHPKVAGLGVGMPGFVDFSRGLVHNLTNVPNWVSIPLRKILEEKTGLPAVVDNRANCMAIAEWRRGAARGFRDVVFVNLETGVGGALIADGRMIRGSRFLAGEIGQTSIDWRGRPGEFGNPGALEQYLGTEELAADARDAYAAAGIQKSVAECSLGALITAAHHGDPVATARWKEIAAMLASALANCCWLLNPEVVVVGGSITRAGELLFEPLREALLASLSHPFTDHLMVVPAAFGHDAGMIGAAALALEEEHNPGSGRP